jgi:hypothetical protein
MAWDIFKAKILRAMEANPQSSDVLADTIVDAWHEAVTRPFVSADIVNKRTITLVPEPALLACKEDIRKIFNEQGKTGAQKELFQEICNSFSLYYWPNASSPLPPSPISFNPAGQITTFGPPLSAGASPALYQALRINSSTPVKTSQWIETFVTTLKAYLLTVNGKFFTITPGGATLQGYFKAYKIGETLSDTWAETLPDGTELSAADRAKIEQELKLIDELLANEGIDEQTKTTYSEYKALKELELEQNKVIGVINDNVEPADVDTDCEQVKLMLGIAQRDLGMMETRNVNNGNDYSNTGGPCVGRPGCTGVDNTISANGRIEYNPNTYGVRRGRIDYFISPAITGLADNVDTINKNKAKKGAEWCASAVSCWWIEAGIPVPWFPGSKEAKEYLYIQTWPTQAKADAAKKAGYKDKGDPWDDNSLQFVPQDKWPSWATANQKKYAKPYAPGRANCRPWRLWGIKNKVYSKKPIVGAAVLIGWGAGEGFEAHIGVVEKVTNVGIETIEGNNGGGVLRHKYALNSPNILGYVYPPSCVKDSPLYGVNTLPKDKQPKKPVKKG